MGEDLGTLTNDSVTFRDTELLVLLRDLLLDGRTSATAGVKLLPRPKLLPSQGNCCQASHTSLEFGQSGSVVQVVRTMEGLGSRKGKFFHMPPRQSQLFTFCSMLQTYYTLVKHDGIPYFKN